jgi:hypothetical protein
MENTIIYTAKFTHHDLKFHKVLWTSDNDLEVGLDGRTEGQTDRQADSYISPQIIFAGGISMCLTMNYTLKFLLVTNLVNKVNNYFSNLDYCILFSFALLFVHSKIMS